MSLLKPDVLLRDLTIPGSHDSGSYPISGIRQCQSMDIETQLNLGVRFLDIRVNKSRNWEIMHEDTPTGKYFGPDCVDVVKAFLDANPVETVLMCVKDEHGSTDQFHDDVLTTLGATGRLSATQAPMALGTPGHEPNLRGKIVLVRRYWIDPNTNTHLESGPDSGLGLRDFKASATGAACGFPSNSDTFDQFKNDNAYVLQQPGGEPFAIQDWYDLQSSFQPSKIALIYKYLDAAATRLSGTWFLNFASTTASGHAWDHPWDFAVGMDNINAAIFTYLVTHGVGRYGTIPMDFVGEEPRGVLALLINTNSPHFT